MYIYIYIYIYIYTYISGQPSRSAKRQKQLTIQRQNISVRKAAVNHSENKSGIAMWES